MQIQINNMVLKGNTYEISKSDNEFPSALKNINDGPNKLYVVGNLDALVPGIAIVGARKATPYGISCSKHFASIAAKNNIVVISGGAYGCDSAAHRAALQEGQKTVVFLGGGCNKPYPLNHVKLFQQVIDCGGAIVSEHDWEYDPLPFTFLQRNRLIAALSKATLIVEAGLPSGTFSTADFAIQYGREVLSIPGAITNENSLGCNQLIYDGAHPVINDAAFYEILFHLFDIKLTDEYKAIVKESTTKKYKSSNWKNPILEAILAQPMTVENLYDIATKKCKSENPNVWLSEKLIAAEQTGLIKKCSNSTYVAVLKG